MRFGNLLVGSALSLMALLAAGWAVPVHAQSEASTQEPALPQSESKSDEEAVDLLSDVERLLRHERIMELDRAKLAEAREELEEHRQFFDDLGNVTYNLSLELEAKQAELEELGAAGSPQIRAALALEIEELEADLELYKIESDLILTAESTLRRQIEALEKKLERHQRAVDALRGVEAVPLPTPSVAEPAEEVIPAGPTVPGVGPRVTPVEKPEPASTGAARRLESTAQVEAQRGVERLQGEVQKAEQAVVEYVKRRESLQQQVEFETSLMDKAQRSVENLETALQRWQSKVESQTSSGAPPAEIQALERQNTNIERGLEKSREAVEKRTEYLASLEDRLEIQRDEEEWVTQQLELKRKDLKEALTKLYWLESPIHPANVSRWFRERGPRILAVILGCRCAALSSEGLGSNHCQNHGSQTPRRPGSHGQAGRHPGVEFSQCGHRSDPGRRHDPGVSGGRDRCQDGPGWCGNSRFRPGLRRSEPDAGLLYRLHDPAGGSIRAG